jgi:hypothetical protein
MSRDPKGGAFDNPRLAEALARLKDGLEDGADPLYDSWKLQRKKADGAPEPAPTLPTDTIPVAVITYRVFPRWALLFVAAAILFAVCALAVHALRRGARGETVAPSAGEPPAVATNAAPPPATAEPAPSAAAPRAPSNSRETPAPSAAKPPRHRETGIFREPGF